MIKSINGKQYKTTSARAVGSWSNTTESGAEEEQIVEVLYRKRSGEYFLHGKGGAATRYGKRKKGNIWQPGEDIIPLTKQQAQIWAKMHLSEDLYSREFEVVQESAEHKMLTLYLPVSTIEMIRRLTADTGHRTMSGLIDDLVRKEYQELEAADAYLRKIFSEYAEIQGQQLLAEYEEAKKSGKLGEIPASLDARCRALIKAAGRGTK